MSFFHNAQNVNVHGQSVSFIGTQNNNSQTVDEGLKILYQHAAPGALHNSGERFDPPKVHPGTRVALQQAIMEWLDDPDSEVAMWLNGAMGAGKSAIAQAIAELCFQQGRLLSSFFFARASADRNNSKRLVATLAYQISLQIPETRPYLSAAILHDPLIFKSSLQSQLDRLIIGPLSRVPITSPEPKLIIIDGLDECENGDARAQALIVNAFVSSITVMRQKYLTPYKILIASRPEIVIKDAFNNLNLSPSTRKLSLNELWRPDADIRRFLVDAFAELRRTRSYLPADWPPRADIDQLVQKSSGHFIYASVVMKFLQSPRHHPIQSLNVILGLLEDSNTRPYAELDALYAHILSKVDNINLVLRILCYHLAMVSCPIDDLFVTTHGIEAVLQFPEETVHIAFNDLVSVIRLDKDSTDSDDAPREDAAVDGDACNIINVSGTAKIKILHSSFTEYLKDQDRSGGYYVMNEKICAGVANSCLEFIIEAEHSDESRHKFLCLAPLPELAAHSSDEDRMTICSTISNLNIRRALEDISITDFSMDIYPYYGIPSACAKVLDWVCKNHDHYSTSDMPHILSKAIEDIYTWILDQFKKFPFSGADRVDGVDLWIFAPFSFWDQWDTSYSPVFVGLSTFLVKDMTLLSEPIDFEELEQFFGWDIIGKISREILGNSKLLGKYAMTEERYLNAGIRLYEGLLDFCLNHDRGSFEWIFSEHGTTFLDGFCMLLGECRLDEGLCTLLERTLAHDVPQGFDGNRTAELSDTARRIYAYFWRNIEFPADCDKYVSDLAEEIATYIKKTREFMSDTDSSVEESEEEKDRAVSEDSEVQVGILGKRKLSLGADRTPEYAEKRAREEVHPPSSNKTRLRLCPSPREPTGSQNNIELNTATPDGNDSFDTSHIHSNIFPHFPNAHGSQHNGAPTDGGWLQGNAEWLDYDWNTATATPGGDGSFNTLHNHGNFLPNLPEAHASEYGGALMDGGWFQPNVDWFDYDWSNVDWTT